MKGGKKEMEKKTIILGYKKCEGVLIPIIECIHRKDCPKGLRFYCVFCKREHLHGEVEGYRHAHCHNEQSPFNKKGYFLKLKTEKENVL